MLYCWMEKRSASFSVAQGVAQGCSLSPILLSVDILKEVGMAKAI